MHRNILVKPLALKVVTMDQITIKTPNPKCRLYWCLIEFMLVFSTPLANYRLSKLLTGSPPTPPPFPVWGGEEGIGLCGEHIQ
jgi:hypothetical protein